MKPLFGKGVSPQNFFQLAVWNNNQGRRFSSQKIEWLVSNPDAQYIAIDGPQSTKGIEPKLNQTGISGWMVNYISKSCKDPAKAMQFFTYLQSEYGGILTNYGIEGKTFEYNADHKIKLLPEVEEIKEYLYYICRGVRFFRAETGDRAMADDCIL